LCSLSFSLGSNGVIPDAPIQVPIITSDEDLSDKKQKEEIINERVVTKVAYLEEKESLQRDTTGSLMGLSVYHFLLVF
jgi:hypothetical protein